MVCFDDVIWHSRSDYLFFRNNVPDHERLRVNLVRKKGLFIGSLGYWVIGVLDHWGIGSLGNWGIGSLCH